MADGSDSSPHNEADGPKYMGNFKSIGSPSMGHPNAPREIAEITGVARHLPSGAVGQQLDTPSIPRIRHHLSRQHAAVAEIGAELVDRRCIFAR